MYQGTLQSLNYTANGKTSDNSYNSYCCVNGYKTKLFIGIFFQLVPLAVYVLLRN